MDRLLSNNIHNYILNASYIPKTLQIARAALFPNNAPGPARQIPDAIEIIAIKRKAAEAIAGVLPENLGARFFGLSHGTPESQLTPEASGEIGVGKEDTGASTKEAIIGEVDQLLGVLGDAYMNKHLIFGILSLVILRLAPEMGTKGVGELMRERVADVEDY